MTMPQALTVSELTAMKDQLKNLTNMTYSDARNIITNTYLQINNKGYGYAALAADVVQQTCGSGNVAISYLQSQAAKQGVPVDKGTLLKIEAGLANAYFDTLIAKADQNGGIVKSDVNFSEALNFHTQVFAKVDLGPQTWTLYEPAQQLPKQFMDQYFSSIIDPNTSVSTNLLLNSAIAKAMFDKGNQAALNWLDTVSASYSDIFHSCKIGSVTKDQNDNVTSLQFYTDTDGNGTLDKVETKTSLGGGFTQDKIDTNNDNKFDYSYIYDQKGTQFDLSNKQQLIAVDNEIRYSFLNGGINQSIYNNITQENSTLLVSMGGYSFNNAPLFQSNLLPYSIGAFYESASVAFDPASTIAAKTGRVFAASTTNGVTTYVAQTAAQLAALDTNKDGKLTGTELGTLFIFQDINENGTSNTGELKSLTAAGVTAIRSTDYGLYSAGSARLGGAE